jgi:hypothetical protein
MVPSDPGTPWPAADAPIRDIEFDEALHYVELMGKRLPTIDEYQCAAGRDPSAAGWAETGPDGERRWPIRGVGHPELDRLPTVPPLVGVRSNVGEWTTTWATIGQSFPLGEAPAELRDLRFVFGAPPSAIVGHADDQEDVYGLALPIVLPRRQHWAVNWQMPLMNVGFRGCRSLAPPYLDAPSA